MTESLNRTKNHKDAPGPTFNFFCIKNTSNSEPFLHPGAPATPHPRHTKHRSSSAHIHSQLAAMYPCRPATRSLPFSVNCLSCKEHNDTNCACLFLNHFSARNLRSPRTCRKTSLWRLLQRWWRKTSANGNLTFQIRNIFPAMVIANTQCRD